MPKLWLFDLDDTLFEASGGMLHKIHLLMNEYMCRELGMEWEEASALRRRYWSVYGATFLGLWRHHGIDPDRTVMKDAGSELVTVCNVKTNFRVVWQVWFAISVGFQGLFQFFR